MSPAEEAADPRYDQVERLVRRVLVEELGRDPGKMEPASRLEEDLGLDSLGMVELFLAVEQAGRVEIPDEAATHIRTVADLVEAVAGLL